MSEQSPVLPVLQRGMQALGLELNSEQLVRFALLSTELAVWNTRVNLTSIADRHDIQVRHFLDSLALAPVVQRELPSQSGKLIDVGSGGGFPGIPLAIALPWLDVALLEATGKKVKFLEHAAAVLGTGNATAIQGRAETVAHGPDHREAYDVAAARAVGSAATLVELLVPFLKVGGVAILMKTGSGLEVELGQAAGALERLHAEVERVVAAPVTELEGHVLVLVRKRESTPAGYPRRPGVPDRNPLR